MQGQVLTCPLNHACSPSHVSKDDDNNMCARDTRIVINAYVLRELDRATCTASIISFGAFFPERLLYCFR